MNFVYYYNAGVLELTDEYSQNLADNKLGGIYTWFMATWLEDGITTLPEGAEPAEYVGLDVTAYPEEKTLLDMNSGCLSGIPRHAVTSSADPEVIGRILDYICTDEYITFSEYGLEGYTYDVVDGEIMRKTGGESTEEQLMSGNCTLWAHVIFPRVSILTFESDLSNLVNTGKSKGFPETGWVDKAEPVYNIFDNQDDYLLAYNSPDTIVAEATLDEATRYSELFTDFETYYRELCLNLIMGEKSLDNWDSYIADMQELGLDELISIYQARYDRTK